MSRQSRPALRAALIFMAVLALCTAWLAFRGLQIRENLLSAREQLSGVSDGLLAGDAEPAAAVLADVAQARAAARDPLWRLASAVPVAGESFAAAGDATEATALLVEEVLPAAQRLVERVRTQPPLVDGRVDLGLLDALQPDVEVAATAAARARAVAERADDGRLPQVVQRLRAELVDQTAGLDDGLQAARTGLALAPGMLGRDEPRRYFVAVMNNAETRGPGGLVGAYVVLTADDGVLTREAVGTNNDFRSAPAPVVDLGPQFSALYDRSSSRQNWSAAVQTPHWPSAAAILGGLWQAQGGGPIDGVIGVDPLAMQEIMAVSGPVTVGERRIGADTVVDYVLRDEYEEFREEPDGERQEVLSELAEGIYDAVLRADYAALPMAQALAGAGREGHLQVWSSRPDEQQVLSPRRLGGTLADVDGAYLQVVMNNAAGNKVDYYLRRRVTYIRADDGTAEVTAQLTNTVDPAQVPPIVIGRLDEPDAPVEPGTTRQLVSLYIGAGQEVLSVSVNGEPVSFTAAVEQGHGLANVAVEVAPSSPTVITARVTDPGGPLLYRQQPLVVDDDLDLRIEHRVG
jgi:hypothetical protein